MKIEIEDDVVDSFKTGETKMINETDLEAWGFYSELTEFMEDIDGMYDYQEFVESLILTSGDKRLPENILGLVGEAGEVAEKIKKYIRDGVIDMDAIQKELGDVMFYWVALHGVLDLDIPTTIAKNIEKLSKRFETGTLQGEGDSR